MLKDKQILIISPQNWNTRKVSKHHYAREFAKSAEVYFLNPPNYGFLNQGIKLKEISDNLIVVDFILPIPKFFKFKWNNVFRFFVSRFVAKLKTKIGHIDFLWNFDNGTYFKEEALFDTAVKVFHPVDDFQITMDYNYLSYDIGFAVSPDILYKVPIKNKLFINHGVIDLYLDDKKKQIVKPKIKPHKAVYVGNLSIRFLDIITMEKVITEHNDILFEFIGDYDVKTDFIKFLEAQKNVKLLGPIYGKDLEVEINNADIFLLCYKKQQGYFGDNSHKILEYMSTGNVIVSSYLSVYKDLKLFPMSLNPENEDYVDLFSEVILNFEEHNSKVARIGRVNYATDNTYSKQVKRIEDFLNKVI